ncbi:hypothetical protein [Agromyces albus]|uniref:Uncharacterized protein n=1 Tax=Agromyces albus TaxID=205332 RepID=A0A4Q2L099_9MICO|nr:hypothetical protein [Agromyces albus]RXZ71425.1 hypothetical protein ESP51_07765 [Agromyces albus]
MRVFEVDERDSTWESDRARYRLYLFEGPGNAVTTLDLLDAQIHDVLEAAALAGKDDKLWAIALVVDESTAGRGLIWLSGMDYNDTPVTAPQWRARATMQNRYLMAKHSRGQPPLLPDGRRVIRVFPDHGHRWPLWENFTDKYAMEPSDYNLSKPLSEGFRRWYDEWERRGIDWRPDDTWKEEGLRLVQSLQAEVVAFAEVRPEFDR